MTDSIPELDQLSLGAVKHRVRSLTAPALRELIEHEEQHGNRLPVLEILRSRLEQLEAEPTGGDPTRAPGTAKHAHGSPVQEATAAESTTPLRHGMAEQTPHPAQRLIAEGRAAPLVPEQLLRAATWRAARDGLTGSGIHLPSGRPSRRRTSSPNSSGTSARNWSGSATSA